MDERPLPKLSFCIDGYLEGAGYDERDVPSPIDPRSTSREELALARYKLWDPGQCLRIRFLDGEKILHDKVAEHACKWLEFANLEFQFGNYSDAEIRVTFIGNGYWSLVGTDAKQCSDPKPTMMLGGFTKDTDPIEIRRVTIHEFGHAIGCVHEQSSPSVNIPWDIVKVYKYYAHSYGWNKELVDRNILKRYGASEVHFTGQHDPKSIMQYPIPRELTTGGFEIGWNTELSEMDTIFIAKMYPK